MKSRQSLSGEADKIGVLVREKKNKNKGLGFYGPGRFF